MFSEFGGVGVEELPPVGGREGDAEQTIWSLALAVSRSELAAVPVETFQIHQT